MSTNGKLTKEYVLSVSAKYAIVVNNINAFQTFLAQYGESNLAKDANGDFTGDFDTSTPLGNAVYQVGLNAASENPNYIANKSAAEITAEEASLVYFVSNYNTGITLLKADSSGNFQPLHVTATTVNGVTVYTSSPYN